MARKSKEPAAPAPSSVITINPFGPTEQRKVTRSKVADSTFTLEDGTTLTLRPIVGDIRRAVDQYNEKGEPLYFLAIGATLTTKSPKRLQKSAPKSTTNKKQKE